MEKYVVFHVEGGLGKNVASTAVIKNIAEKYLYKTNRNH